MSGIDFRLDGRVALVTGGSRGIGLAIARGFVQAGARVVISARKMEGLEKAARELRELGGEVAPIACNTGNLEQIRDLADRALETYGAIDVLVNNAGTNPYFGPAVEAPESAWEKTLGVNLKGYFFMAQAAARVMVRQGGGRIINISSMIGYSNSPMTVIYGITKAGVISMTRALAKELAPHNIRVNAIAPGFVATDFSAAVVENPQLHASVVAGTPLGRIGEADEVAGAAVYLASDASSYVTGAVITVDGGTLA